VTTPLLEIEGTADEIRERLADFGGKRLHVTISEAAPQSEPAAPEHDAPKNISERLMDLFSDAPAEERARVPADLTDSLDHYIYGLPKT
jgi:hypothetical protein